VSNPVITPDQLDTPLTYEDMQAIGTGLGSAGFIVFDDTADMAAVAAGVSRFLGVESCGQCTPCKLDGMALAAELGLLVRDEGTTADMGAVRSLVSTVGDRARCYLGTQHQVVVSSLVARFGPEFDAHASRRAAPADPRLVTELLDIVDDRAVLDEHYLAKQPD
jgi:NADH:ubiquinone oxidoreductase subunit F (NADH-binding)